MPNFNANKLFLYALILLATVAVTGCANRDQTISHLPPLSAEEQLSTANSELRKGKSGVAYRAYSNVLSNSPQSHEAYYGRGLAALHLGKNEQALFDLSRASEIAPDNVTYLREKGIAQQKNGKPEMALRTLNKVLELKPKDDNALLARGLIYLSQQMKDKAVTDFTTLIKRSSPLSASAYYNRAQAIQDTNAEQALANYIESHKLAPQDSRPLNSRGVLLLSLGRYSEAHNELDAAIACDNESPKLYFNRAIIRENLGNYDEALHDYDKALALAPRYAEALYNRGVLHQRIGNKERACNDLQKVSELGLPDRYEQSIKMGLCE